MADESIEGGMIEIGDPNEDGAVANPPPPQVVIEYRERGVPWMLLPPLLVLSAALAVVGYLALDLNPRRPAEPAPTTVALAPPPGPTTPRAAELVPKAEPVAPVEAPAPVVEPVILPPASIVAEVPAVEPAPEPVPFPRVPGLGFDPRALEADPNPAAPPVNPAIAPAGQGDGPGMGGPGVDPAVGPGGPDQPEEVDPNVLPADPRLARLRQARRLAEARQQANADRGKFHAELKAICRKFGVGGGDQINELIQQYGVNVEPSVKREAVRLLNGPAAGAGTPTRINILRAVGFPESAILADMFAIEIAHLGKASKEGPGSDDAALYRAALTLLNHPPTRAATANRAASAPRAGFNARPSARPGPAR